MLRGKVRRVSSRNPLDERGQVHMADAAAVLRGNLHGGGIRYHKLPAVPLRMVIDAGAQSVQQRTFT